MRFVDYCNKVIEYSFYLLFFLVPIYFANDTSELYELNKMWLTWGVTIIIVVAWVSKMIATKRIVIQRTVFDLPLLGFLLSQFISTIFSLDTHVSLWGYYSRFNGGFYSLLSYVVLYYAFVSNYADIDAQHEDGTARFSKGVRTILLLAGFCIIPLAIRFSAPPASNPEAVHSTFLLLSLLVAFFFFA